MNACKHCKKISQGRADKKFCSLECKNEYHNERKRTLFGAPQRSVVNGLRRNFIAYTNLLNKKSSIEMSLDDCRMLGIDPQLVTRTDGSGNQFCFGFRIEYLAERQIKVSKQ